MSLPAPSAARTLAPAKVNLGLHVMPRRPDGFHALRSVFLRLDLADEVTLAAADGGTDRLTVEGDPDCPVEGNLALDACAAFRGAATRGGVPPVAVRLRKRIPMAAGLAGGSSDAAAVLRLLARRHPGVLDDLALPALARSLGSDVPFFLGAAGAALVSGTGDALESLPPPIAALGVVLVKPAVGLRTGEVFEALDTLRDGGALGPGDPGPIERVADALRSGASPGRLVELAPLLRHANDLWPAAVTVEPRLASLRAALEARLRQPVLMTGSGSTLFALYPDAAAAERSAHALDADPPPGLAGAWVAACASGTPYPPDVVTVEEGA